MRSPTRSKSVPVPAEVLRGIRKAQASDNVNEYSAHEVIASAMRIGERDTLEWLLKHHDRYSDGVFHGFVEEA